MTPVPLDLPLQPPDAAELASLVFSFAERKPLNEEVRARIASRLAGARFGSLRPYPASLERDPVHHSTYYMAVDGRNGEPLLLHMAPAAAPASAIFPKPLLIGRMRRATGPEMVINAVPFSPANHEFIERFARQINESFLPRPQGSRAAIVACAAPLSFEAFRAVLKRSRKNLAAVAAAPGQSPMAFYYAAVWSAIRAGWREGYGAGIGLALENADVDALREVFQEAAPLTRFAIDVSSLVGANYELALNTAERAHELIRQARAARKITRPFDFELSLQTAHQPTTPDDLSFCLEWLKNRGHAAQFVAPRIGTDSDISALAAAAQSAQCTLSLDSQAGDLGSIGRATAGRVNFRLAAEATVAETAAELFG